MYSIQAVFQNQSQQAATSVQFPLQLHYTCFSKKNRPLLQLYTYIVISVLHQFTTAHFNFDFYYF